MAKRHYGSTKEMMKKAGRMIHDEMSAPCLLPREVMDKDWPKEDQYSLGMVNDLFDEAQRQLSMDASGMRREHAAARGKKW
jgi:hypothetical protein